MMMTVEIESNVNSSLKEILIWVSE